MRTGELFVPTGWPRATTPCALVPKWVGEFCDFDDWVHFATARLQVPKGSPTAICVDTLGRRCSIGWHFMRARDEGTFPIRYFFECEPAEGRPS